MKFGPFGQKLEHYIYIYIIFIQLKNHVFSSVFCIFWLLGGSYWGKWPRFRILREILHKNKPVLIKKFVIWSKKSQEIEKRKFSHVKFHLKLFFEKKTVGASMKSFFFFSNGKLGPLDTFCDQLDECASKPMVFMGKTVSGGGVIRGIAHIYIYIYIYIYGSKTPHVYT